MITKSSTKMNGALNVNWDSYWKGFMSNPGIEKLRFTLVKGAYQRLLKSITFPPEPHFCELGAGTGKTSRFLGDQYSAQISIVDNNPKALALNREIFKDFKGSHKQITENVLNLTGLDQRFDLVHSGGLIEHFVAEAREAIIKIHVELIKPSGLLLILVPTRNMWYRVLNEGVFKALHLLDHIPEEPWDIEELTAALKRHNCTIITTTMVVTELGVLARRNT